MDQLVPQVMGLSQRFNMGDTSAMLELAWDRGGTHMHTLLRLYASAGGEAF